MPDLCQAAEPKRHRDILGTLDRIAEYVVCITEIVACSALGLLLILAIVALIYGW